MTPGSSVPPSFIITIDTEGDDLWSKPRQPSTRNAEFLPRFQAACERHGFKPTYLVNYEMARCPALVELGRDVIARGVGEVGMHLHAWDTPPLHDLTGDDSRHQPYLIEYPTPIMREKVARMTELLEDTFGVAMLSHRAGRWAFNEVYAEVLLEHSYRADCSVTPHISWVGMKGDPNGSGGSDYTNFPEHAYRIDPADIGRPGDSTLLEVPATIVKPDGWMPETMRSALERVPRVRRYIPAIQWLRPDGHNRRTLLGIVERAAREQRDYLEFMLHSSEFMPGGSPTFVDEDAIERLYGDLDELFSAAVAAGYAGRTLAEYAGMKMATPRED